jgi:hypothetical protein
MAQTSRPERTRSLPNLNLKSRHKYLRMPTLFDLGRIRRFEKQLHCFLQVRAGSFDSVALTRDIELRTKTDVPAAFPFDDRRELLRPFHWDSFGLF